MAKKTQKIKPAENLARCYISKPKSAELVGDGGMGETFWINKLSDTTAEVRNNCLCGLCVGDIINIKTYDHDDGIHHPNEFVSVNKRKYKAFHLHYTFDGMDKSDKFPKKINDFINKLREQDIRFEGMVKGMAAMSYPVDMDDDDFLHKINSGPMQFSQNKIKS